MGESCPATLTFMLCSPLAGIFLVGSRYRLLEKLNMDWLLRDPVSRMMSAGGMLRLALLFTRATARAQATAYPNDGTFMAGRIRPITSVAGALLSHAAGPGFIPWNPGADGVNLQMFT